MLPRRNKEHDEKLADKHLFCVGDKEEDKKRTKVDGEEYWVLARGMDNFEALSGVGRVLEKNRHGSNLTTWDEVIYVTVPNTTM